MGELFRKSSHNNRIMWIEILLSLSILITLGTVYALRLNGITLEREPQRLECAFVLPAGDAYADFVVHTHNADCYDADGMLVCPLEQIKYHQHSESCYDTDGNLICSEREVTPDMLHTHGPSCFDATGECICGQLQIEEHVHGPACFRAIDQEQEEPEAPETPESAWRFEGEAGQLRVLVEADAGAFSEGTTMLVRPVAVDSVLDAVSAVVDGQVTGAQAVDITFYDALGNEIEPRLPIRVSISAPAVTQAEAPVVVHVDDNGSAEVVEQDAESGDETVRFTADSFSIYVLVSVSLEQTIQASDGSTYTIRVSYGADAGIPDGAELRAAELDAGSTRYDDYLSRAESALGWEEGMASYARFFDISIWYRGRELQPASSVDVTIELADLGDQPSVVHFGHGEPDVVDAAVDGGAVSFAADGFSVYAIVEAPPSVPASGWVRVESLEELATLGSEGVYIRQYDGYYFSNTMYTVSGTRTGILKSTPASNPDLITSGNLPVKYYFELVDGTTDQFTVYCYDSNNQKRYINQTANSLSLVGEENATVFTVAPFGNTAKTFYVMGSDNYCWNMQGNAGGRGFAAWNNPSDNNARMQFDYYNFQADDPYHLDGKSFGIAYHDDSTTSVAMTSRPRTGSQQRLLGQDMVMRPDVLDNDGILLVAEGSDITQWTFHSQGGDTYYITTTVDGQTKYLTINNNNVTLEDEPDPVKSLVTATPGSGTHAGRWHFSVGNRSLNLVGKATDGFNAVTGSGATTWLNLVEESILGDEDFTRYTAKKVSVSDAMNVYNGQQVVIYTRIWNEAQKKYEFYAIDHDGSLIRCYDTGDGIEWIGSQVNTALWEFTEYTGSDGLPSFYYELQNTQYGNYLAPQVTGGQTMSDSTIGVNLNGRRNGENFTTIVAWDDPNYSYAGLRAEDGRIVACTLPEADDFFFAVMQTVDPEDELTTVATVDGSLYGISMKMIDFNNGVFSTSNYRDIVQHPFFGNRDTQSHDPGLLSTNLGPNGYPTTTALTGHEVPLSNLFNNMTDVNHLFLQSIYNESGYFEYDSTSNFAHLNPDGNFTVYDQIAAIGVSTGPTRTHGQFMPFNDIVAGRYAKDNNGNLITNQTDVMAQELSDMNARKGEPLYSIPQSEADYFFGMEMTASFTQTASGLDAWGHDIIFEFSGDDDFWLYVDDELVLDLGGVRSAMSGSVNFRTGRVIYGSTDTTLYDVFRSHYEERGMTTEEIDAKLDEIFTLSPEGNHVFKDYTNHTMRMFYMERGAGASNLHMRFNLAAVKAGTVVLSKKLSGTDHPSNNLIEFPYQIYYKSPADHQYHLLTEKTGDAYNVTYKDTINPVTYLPTFTPAGGTQAYEHVFFLKPGQSAVIDLPDDAIDYYIVECGVNPAVYDEVKANGEVLTGTASAGNPGREDYAVPPAAMTDRSQVDYDNHVADGAIQPLSITKWLYDVNGVDRLHYPDNSTLFSFRLYLGTENADPNSLPAANMYSYYVKDANGNYCRWDAANQCFQSLGISSYAALSAYMDTLTPAQVSSIIFTTSMYGSISKIPADYTVEVRDLVVGTQWKVEERDYEIPKGYTLRLTDGYTRVDTNPEVTTGTTPITGTIRVNEAPEVQVRNQKGWGLTVKKIWTDVDFMAIHDTIYFAVYTKSGTDPDATYTLLPGSVRQLVNGETELYYFFDDLEANTPFENYYIFEVTLEGDPINVNEKGYVIITEDDDITVTPIAEGGTLTIGGQPFGGEYQANGFSYSVSYKQGQPTGHNENVRTDTVTNSRPGLKLYKTDWSGTPLEGAVFTLKDDQGNDVAAASYTSDGDGLITIAYLNPGTYTLEETSVPRGYAVLPSPLTITVGSDETISVSGLDASYYNLTQATETEMAVITLKNRTASLEVKKVDGDDPEGVPLAGAHFALYRQVIYTAGPGKDYLPMQGYEDLVTDADGIVPDVTMELTPGTYYLTETQAPEGYERFEGDLCFSIWLNGTVTLHNHPEWLSEETDEATGHSVFTVSIEDRQVKKVSFKKVDAARPDSTALAGAKFDLYRVVDGVEQTPALYTGLTSYSDGMIYNGSEIVFTLELGTYHLVETEAPTGYNPSANPFVITVSLDDPLTAQPDEVSYSDGTNYTLSGEGVSYDPERETYTLYITNDSGFELPVSGGVGTRWAYLAGFALLALAALMIFRRRRLSA